MAKENKPNGNLEDIRSQADDLLKSLDSLDTPSESSSKSASKSGPRESPPAKPQAQKSSLFSVENILSPARSLGVITIVILGGLLVLETNKQATFNRQAELAAQEARAYREKEARVRAELKREREARQKAARELAERDRASKEQAAKEKAAREQASRKRAAREQAAREQAARAQAAREREARKQAAARGVFAAISYSQDTGSWGSAWNYKNKLEAEQSALRECSKYGSGCEVVMWTRNACAALATSPGNGYGSAWAESKYLAERKALNLCNKSNQSCSIQTTVCND